jgi:uncharacterized membrane protein YhhN
VELIGWVLFTASALFFSVNAQNLPELLGGLTFLAGCIAFLVAQLAGSRAE